MKTEEYFEELEKVYSTLGIKKGDNIYIASNITAFAMSFFKCAVGKKGNVDDFLNMFIDNLISYLGEDGTILIPVFNWDFCKGIEFIYEKTPGQTGSLGNWVLEKRKDFKRTYHPIYSFVVRGKDEALLLSLKNVDSWGIDSPFHYLHKSQAKMLMINVDSGQCNTFEHYIEEMISVPYRYMKDFVGNYQINRESERRVYRMYVRDLQFTSKQLSADRLYIEHGIMNCADCFDNTFRLLDLAASVQVVAEDMFMNKGRNFYEFDNYELDWKVGRTHKDDLIRVGDVS